MLGSSVTGRRAIVSGRRMLGYLAASGLLQGAVVGVWVEFQPAHTATFLEMASLAGVGLGYGLALWLRPNPPHQGRLRWESGLLLAGMVLNWPYRRWGYPLSEIPPSVHPLGRGLFWVLFLFVAYCAICDSRSRPEPELKPE